MKKTPWYPGDTQPAREGWYERDYTRVLGNDAPSIYLDLWLPFRNGEGFWYVNDPEGQLNDAHHDHLPWRGLARQSK